MTKVQKRSDYPKQKETEKKVKTPFWPKVGRKTVVAFQYAYKGIVRAILAVTVFAGVMYLLDGVDQVIKWPAAIILTALLLKESY